RAALFGAKKSDPVEARACARFAPTEKPAAAAPVAPALRLLRQAAGRLQAVVRQRTRLINQLHHLLALSFPELALLAHGLSQGWVLELVHRYPPARLLGAADAPDLDAIAYLPARQVGPLLEHALYGDTNFTKLRDANFPAGPSQLASPAFFRRKLPSPDAE